MRTSTMKLTSLFLSLMLASSALAAPIGVGQPPKVGSGVVDMVDPTIAPAINEGIAEGVAKGTTPPASAPAPTTDKKAEGGDGVSGTLEKFASRDVPDATKLTDGNAVPGAAKFTDGKAVSDATKITDNDAAPGSGGVIEKVTTIIDSADSKTRRDLGAVAGAIETVTDVTNNKEIPPGNTLGIKQPATGTNGAKRDVPIVEDKAPGVNILKDAQVASSPPPKLVEAVKSAHLKEREIPSVPCDLTNFSNLAKCVEKTSEIDSSKINNINPGADTTTTTTSTDKTTTPPTTDKTATTPATDKGEEGTKEVEGIAEFVPGVVENGNAADTVPAVQGTGVEGATNGQGLVPA